MSVLLTNLGVSLKWITVTLETEMDQKHGANCFSGIFDSGKLESHLHFVD